MDALLKEIGMRQNYLEEETVETIYLGGGTPSLLDSSDVDRLMWSIAETFSLASSPEITLEANPDDVRPEKLAGWKASGVNRLSIGVQSFFDDDLRWMNRSHTAADALQAIGDSQRAGFNLTIDLIYGTPLTTCEKWQHNLETAVGLGVPHLSCYALTVEPRTLLYQKIRQGKTASPDQQEQAEQFLFMVDSLEKAGYVHYEISNFAKDGKKSRHNTSYWTGKKYLGLGPSAHSYNGQSRQWTVSSTKAYIQAIKRGQLPFEKEVLSPSQIRNEYIMTSIRTSEGIDLNYFTEHFGPDACRQLVKRAGPFLLDNRAYRYNQHIILTTKGKLFADGIAAELFFEPEKSS